MKYLTLLLAAVLAISASEPYAVDSPPVYGAAKYETVRGVQSGLTELGYYGGVVDGIDGPRRGRRSCATRAIAACDKTG